MMFDDRYEVILADTANSKAINFKLRYQVFCLEKGFENADRFRERMERDEHDGDAVHFLVRDKQENRWIAAARLVIGTPDKLPVSKVAKIELHDLAPETIIAEFSRFLIIDDYRGPQGKGTSEPEILLGLIRAARKYCRQAGIAHWVFFCRRALSRILANVGVGVEPIGPACVFRGVRVPYRLDLQTAFDEVPRFSFSAHKILSRLSKSYVSYSSYYALQSARESASTLRTAV